MLLISVMSPTYVKKKKVDNSKGTYNEMRFGYLYDLIISSHYNDVIMSSMASQITSLTIVYIRRRSKKISKLRVTGLCEGNSPGTGEFPRQMASNTENVSIWWRHHGELNPGLGDC